MIRGLKSNYDLLVIGGGITGACIAWDAALRGLRVALVERDDFGAATSANSLKTVHGGLRYLQDADLPQVRKMVRERRAFLRIAPHLVRPLPCLMPTYQRPLMRSKPVLGAAIKLNDLLSLDRNRTVDPARRLPSGRIMSRRECLARLPGLQAEDVTGGVLWYDAQIQNTERLLLSFVLSAAEQGADVANYMTVTGLLQEGERVVGARVEDRLTGRSFQINARLVVNAAGAWADEVLQRVDAHKPQPLFPPSVAMNLITRQIVPQPAFALNSRYRQRLPDGSVAEKTRVLFISPWQGYSIVGTLHMPCTDHAQGHAVDGQVIRDFLDEVNQAYPAAGLRLDDVYHVHHGFLPAEVDEAAQEVKLLREEQLTDHAQQGIQGLVTAVGVKYTTARHLAEKTVDLVFRKLGQRAPACQTDVRPVYGGAISDWQQFRQEAMTNAQATGLCEDVAGRLIDTYGSAFTDVTTYVKENDCWGEPLAPGVPVTKAAVLRAVRREMAQKLSDVVRRRTDLGSAGPPDLDVVRNCAVLVAGELGWNSARMEREIEELYEAYPATIT